MIEPHIWKKVANSSRLSHIQQQITTIIVITKNLQVFCRKRIIFVGVLRWAGRSSGGMEGVKKYFPFVLLYSFSLHISYMFGLFLSIICVWIFPFCHMRSDFSFLSLSLSSSYVLYPMGFVPIIPWMFPRYAWSTIIYSRLLFINKDIESCVTRSVFHT